MRGGCAILSMYNVSSTTSPQHSPGRQASQYVDSGDSALLPRQAEVVVEVRNVLATIRRVTADNVSQQANWEKLSQVSERRLGLMEQAIELK